MSQDRVVWVTGASGAVGAAIVKAFARSGDRVYASSRSIPADAAASDGPVIPLPVDIRSREQIDGAVESIIAQSGRIDVLINSTSVSTFGDFLALTDDDWESVLDTKLLGYMRSARAVMPHMVRQGTGTIINVSGRGGHQPSSAAHIPGSTANAGVDLLTKALATFYKTSGVRAVCIAPGPLRSPRYDSIASATARLGNDNEPNPDSDIAAQGSPEDVAAAALFLASPAARWITGIVMQVDGGGTHGL